jgi:hypothetical protein
MKGPNGEQIRKAERNGVVLWKEIRNIVHIKQLLLTAANAVFVKQRDLSPIP